jgi:hypothetical protein
LAEIERPKLFVESILKKDRGGVYLFFPYERRVGIQFPRPRSRSKKRMTKYQKVVKP